MKHLKPEQEAELRSKMRDLLKPYDLHNYMLITFDVFDKRVEVVSHVKAGSMQDKLFHDKLELVIASGMQADMTLVKAVETYQKPFNNKNDNNGSKEESN